MPVVFTGDSSVILGCTRVNRDQIGVGRVWTASWNALIQLVTVGLEQGKTPDIANSVLSTDSSAADVDNQGTLEAKNLSLLT